MTKRNFFVNHGLECGDIVISAVTNTITGLSTGAPSSDGDVSNKKYVDDQDALIASDTLTFTNKTFDANGTGNSITNIDSGNFLSGFFLDEDDLSSDSATAVASQQSIKAYIDNGLSSLSSTTLTVGDTSAVVSDTGSDGAFTVTCDGNTELVVNDTSATFSGNVIVTGNFTVNGTTTTVNSTNTTLDDNLLELNSGAGSNTNDSGIIIERGSTGDNAIIAWDESADKFTMGTTTATASSTGNLTITAGTLVANLEGAVTGNADTATALETARNIGGVSFDGSANINLPGVNTAGNQNTSGNAATATEATNVTVSANNATNETVYLTFVDGATGTQGIETDTGLSYNPSTNVLTTTATEAQYADLAEKYTTDQEYEVGTVVMVNTTDASEVTSVTAGNIAVGVISGAPAYLMNADSEGQAVALKGRVPVKVTGAVSKGQAVYVDDNGCATASNNDSCMVGIALESNDRADVKLVECIIKV